MRLWKATALALLVGLASACGQDESLAERDASGSGGAGGSAQADAAGGSSGSAKDGAADTSSGGGSGQAGEAGALADAGDAALEAGDAADASDASSGLLPDFGLLDVNPSSARYQDVVSPKDYLGKVSAWYFGHAT